MLDMQYVREQVEIVKQACIDKQLDPAVVDQLIEIDDQRRQKIAAVDELRHQSNSIANQIKMTVSAGQKPEADLIAQGKSIKQKLKQIEPELKDIQTQFENLQLAIPNVPATDVPVASDESGNEVISTQGTLPKFDFEPQSHQDLLEKLAMLDTTRAVKIAGFRAYFLKNDGLLLEQALLKYALDLLLAKGFSPMSVPVMVNKAAMWGTGYFPWGQEDHYVTQDDQVLTGTAEVALTAYHQGEILAEKELPIKICGVSTCFRREVGSYGKDTQGIIRVHQFNKIEQVILTVADETETRSWHQTMLGLSEQLLQNLQLPYQILLMCTGDMGAGQRKKYDIETWFPAQDKYRETHSASYFNDFQARRLNIRYRAKDGSLKYVYTLNNTMAASPRLLAAIVENYQQADGSIAVPEVLQPYMGKKIIAHN